MNRRPAPLPSAMAARSEFIRRRAQAVLAALAWACCANPPCRAQAVLDMGGNEVLRGEPLAYENNLLTWRHSLSGTELRIPGDRLHRLFFSKARPGSHGGDLLLLDNGDLIAGRLEALDANSATITSPNAGRISLPRHRLRAARLAASDPSLAYQDKADLAGWNAPNGEAKPSLWKADQGALAFNGRMGESIARQVPMPDSPEVSFRLSWDANPVRQPQFAILLCANSAKPDESSDHYSLNISSTMLTALRMSREDGDLKQVVLGRIQISSFIGATRSIGVQAIIDRPARRLHLLLNGRVAASWQDTAENAPTGTAIHLAGYPGTPLRVANLRVQSWNGILGGEFPALEGHQEADSLVMDDADIPKGEIVGISSGPGGARQIEMRLSINKSRTLLIDVARIRQILFASPAQPAAVRDATGAAKPGPAVVCLADGSRLSAGSITLSQGRFTMTTPDGQELRLPAESLLSIEFPAFKRPELTLPTPLQQDGAFFDP